MKAPDFWYRPPGLATRLLAPLAALYTVGARRRQAGGARMRPAVPVICVGNPVAGGAGKTPVALALYAALVERGRQPHFLSRGYGGALSGPRPVRVAPLEHDAAQVGDEPLLLAAHGPAWICRDRAAGVAAAAKAGADLVILDDGFQNPALRYDVAVLVVDGGVGIGNGRVLPAGPLREPLADGLARATAMIVVGADKTGLRARLAGDYPHLPVLSARLEPTPAIADALKGRRAVAFAGIGRPGKFFDTLAAMGVEVVAAHPFPDHHPYREADLAPLVRQAENAAATLLTTQKDWTRVPPLLQDRITPVPVTVRFDSAGDLDALLALVPASPPA